MSGIFSDSAVLRSASAPFVGADDVVDTSAHEPRPAEKVPLTAVEPDGPPRGGIVVLHEAREIPESVLDLLRALALEGWLAVAPNLFHRGHGDDKEVFGDDLFADFDATSDWLVQRGVYPDCVGVIGFDDAGTAAFIVATSRPVGAAVSVAAAGIVEPLNSDAIALVDAAPKLQAPWLGLYGEDDPHTPPDHIEALRDAATRSSVATNVVSYSGVEHRADHPREQPGSSDHSEPAEAALVDAQTRIFDWFDSFMR
ncbi:dienelactone hydrolase family protein [Rhodococcus sp. KRD162]|uniref:dienelactone hydrolase family protein n=1 Tax=Rhodococcus sp. KRD162 TaxID=2729725 RepID=UPI0019D06853|nr:dienelactone hydrolase family protein [Rhodococcus sp. KRD162]